MNERILLAGCFQPGEFLKLIQKNGFCFVGKLISFDDKWIVIDDRKLGRMCLNPSEIIQIRKEGY